MRFSAKVSLNSGAYMDIAGDKLNPQPCDIFNFQIGRFGELQNVFVCAVEDGKVWYWKNYRNQIHSLPLSGWRKRAKDWIVL
jgi:hypothetical protein